MRAALQVCFLCLDVYKRQVHILNHAGDEKGAIHLTVDGKPVDGCVIPADGKPGKHHVEAVIE